MQNPRLASRYAKSLLDIAVEKNSVEAALKDMKLLHEICVRNPDFASMLRSPVINGDKKLSIINAVVKSYNTELTGAFIKLLVSKGRELNLPEIAAAFITQYNELKNIKTVKLTTATPVSDSVKSSIQAKLAGYSTGTIELKTSVDEQLIGGFVLEMNDKLYDASVQKKLNDMKTKLLDNSYVSKM